MICKLPILKLVMSLMAVSLIYIRTIHYESMASGSFCFVECH